MAVLDENGLEIPRLEEIRQALVDAFKASPQFGAAFQTAAGSRGGQVIDLFADREAAIWEGLQQVYSAFRSQTADNVHLDNLTGLTGVIREPATKSTGEITPGGTPSTVIPINSRVRVPNGAIFETTAEGTIGGDDIPIQALETGPIEALAGEITQIVDAVAGWTSVTNAVDISPGQDVESDAALRERWQSSFTLQGSCTDSSIAARVRALSFVDACTVLSNRTDTADAYGTPEHNAVTIVWPDTLSTAQENTILELLWAIWPAGIQSWGIDVVGDVIDQNGFLQRMRFTYANEVEIWVTVNITDKSALTYPIDGDNQVEAAVLAYAATLDPSDDVLPSDLLALIVDSVPGIRDLDVLLGKTNPPTLEAPVVIQVTEIASFDAARIAVNS